MILIYASYFTLVVFSRIRCSIYKKKYIYIPSLSKYVVDLDINTLSQNVHSYCVYIYFQILCGIKKERNLGRNQGV